MRSVGLGVGLAIVAVLVVGRVVPWLRAGGHRYPDEADLPPRAFTWVLPVTALVAFLVGVVWAERPLRALVFASFAVFLVLVSAIDVDVHRLPDRWTYPAMVAAPAATGMLALVAGDLSSWTLSLLGGVVLGGFYVLLVVIGALLRGGGMGLGDAKLAPSMGVMLGFLSWGHVIAATFAAILIGGLVAAALLVTRRAGRHSHVPFGPAMAAGAILVLAVPGIPGLVP